MKLRILAAILLCVPAVAQTTLRGHWTGDIETPGGNITLEVDLDQTLSGWIGSVSIPAQGAKGIALEGITFKDGKATFRIRGAGAQAPAFTGTISPDGQSLTGEFVQAASFTPLKLVRTGEAKVELPKSSPPVAPEFVGTWEGTIEAGVKLRVQLVLANVFGASEATLISLDQGGSKIPVNTVAQQGTKLRLKVDSVGGGYEGELSADKTQLTGSWTQQGTTVPLVFKKAAK
ncbi:MAG: hypothetical protein ABIR70_20400 [Bryobacteraceae bacterium]